MKKKLVLTRILGNYIPAVIFVIFLTEGTLLGQTWKSTADTSSNFQNTDEEKAKVDSLVRLMEEVREMREVIGRLEKRIVELEAEKRTATTATTASAEAKSPAVNSEKESQSPSIQPAKAAEDRKVLDFFSTTTFNLMLDGYYGYNFNKPIGRINLLRAYDVMSNSFSLNQAALVIERAPDVEVGRRFGVRVDLQYGQATETLQGNPANELRPQTYRPVFQAFGTYVVPVGNGLTVDFGKWASPLGIENNYSKDQMNYSRSYFFNFLPFYHFGFRAKYPVNDKLTVMYNLVNGVQQSEDFNGFKSQHLALILTPAKSLSWQINYYEGHEARSVEQVLNPGPSPLPTQPGLSTNVISGIL